MPSNLGPQGQSKCVTGVAIWPLLLVTNIGFASAAATMWFDCESSVNEGFNAPATGGYYQAIGCYFAFGTTNVSFAGLDANASASAIIRDGRVSPGVSSGIWASYPLSRGIGSISLTLTGMTFGQGASFRFTGAFPPGSRLVVTNNTFSLNSTNVFLFQLPSKTTYAVTAIYIGRQNDAMILENTAEIEVSNNTMTIPGFNDPTRVLVMIYITCQSASLLNGSKISTSFNRITDGQIIRSGATYVAYINIFTSSLGNSTVSLILANKSSLLMSFNEIGNSTITTASDNAYVATLELFSPASVPPTPINVFSMATVFISNTSSITLGSNSIRSSEIRNGAIVAQFYIHSTADTRVGLTSNCLAALQLSENAMVTLDSNSVRNSSVNGNLFIAYLRLMSKTQTPGNGSTSQVSVDLTGQSQVSLSNNAIVYSAVVINVQVAYLYSTSNAGDFTRECNSSSSISLRDRSAVVVNGNSMRHTSGYISIVTQLQPNSYSGNSRYSTSICAVTIFDSSALTMDGNEIFNCTVNKAYVAYFYPYSTSASDVSSSTFALILRGESKFTMSSNYITQSTSVAQIYVAYHLAFCSASSTSSSSSSTVAISLTDKSSTRMDGNVMNSSTAGGIVYVSYFGPSSESRLQNGTTSLSNVTVALSGASIVSLSHNYATTARGSIAYLYSVSASPIATAGEALLVNVLSIDGRSSLIINQNRFLLTAMIVVINMVQIQIVGRISLTDGATLTMSGNMANSPDALVFLALTVSNITMDGGSALIVASNYLSVTGYSKGYSTLLALDAINSGPGSVVLSGRARIDIRDNYMEGYVLVLAAKVFLSLQPTSALLINSNTALVLFMGAFIDLTAGLSLDGSLVVTKNTISGPIFIPSYYLLEVIPSFANGSDATVVACSNNISWSGSAPVFATNMTPPELKSLVGNCIEHATALTVSLSNIITPSATLTTSHSANFSSRSVTVDPTTTIGTAHTPLSPTGPHPSLSQSNADASDSVLLASETQVIALTESQKRTVTERTRIVSRSVAQNSLSRTLEGTSRWSWSNLCRQILVQKGAMAVYDTCEEGEDTTSETVGTSAKYFIPLVMYVGNSDEQNAIKASYSNNSEAPLPSDSLYGSFHVTWPANMASVSAVSDATPSLSACWIQATNATSALIHVAVAPLTLPDWSSNRIPVARLRLTINVSRPSTSGGGFSYKRTVALERPFNFLPKRAFVPDKAVKSTATTTGALSITVGAVAVPIAAMQQGVALALLRMAQCEVDALNGEPLDVPVHPLQFAIGMKSNARYARGAVIGNLLIIPFIWCVLGYFLAPAILTITTNRTLSAAREFVGWPGMALMPFAVLSEGSAMASVGLMTQGTVEDLLLGLFGLAILIVTATSWATELWRMSGRLTCIKVANLSRSEFLIKAIRPRYVWCFASKKRGNRDDDDDNDDDVQHLNARSLQNQSAAKISYLDKRMQLVGSSWWLWSSLAAHLLSLLVGLAESLPVSLGLCRVRWGVASLAAVLQAVVVMTDTVPIEQLLLGAIGGLNCALVVLVAFTTFQVGSADSTYSALNAVGLVSSCLGIALLLIGVCTAAYELVSQQAIRANGARRIVAAVPLQDIVIPIVEQDDTTLERQSCEDLASTAQSSDAERDVPVIEAAAPRGSGNYGDMPAQWATILEEAERAAYRKN